MAYMILSLLLLFCVGIIFCVDIDYVFYGKKLFNDSAWAAGTDKAISHTYRKMYGTLLLPMLERYTYERKPMKFLEIGLGCNMWYGPGASVGLWKSLFRDREVELWEAEANATCVERASKKGLLEGLSVVTGDQADYATLTTWVRQSGGHFDVIVDDGGHHNSMILNSLAVLWPELNPGGWYFIEDLHISYHPAWLDPGYPPTALVLQTWIEVLQLQPYPVSHHHRHLAARYPLPHQCDMILCQREACALHKEDSSGL